MKKSASSFECGNCGQPEKKKDGMNVCGRCRRVRYCDRACQSAHWKKGGHKKLCLPPEACKPCDQPQEDRAAEVKCLICLGTDGGTYEHDCSALLHPACLMTLHMSDKTRIPACPQCRKRLPPYGDTMDYFFDNSQFENACEFIRAYEMSNQRQLMQGTLFLWSKSCIEMGRIEKAAQLFKDMVKNDETDYYPHHELAIWHLQKSEYDLAEIEYRWAVKLEPKGSDYASMDIVGVVDKAITPTTMSSLYYQFGRVLCQNLTSRVDFEEEVRTGKYTLATPLIAELLMVLNKSIELNPDDCHLTLHQRAFIYYIASDFPNAMHSARLYITLCGENADNAENVAKALTMIEESTRLMRANVAA